MKKTAKRITASVLAAMMCLSAGAMATTAVNAAEIDTASVQASNSTAMLRNGIWQAVSADGSSVLIDVDNAAGVMHIHSADYNIGVAAMFEFNQASSVYTVHQGCAGNIDYWTLTSNNGRVATMNSIRGKSSSLFYLGSGSLDDIYSLHQLRGMAQNYFEERHGYSDSVFYTASLKNNGSGLAEVRVYQTTSYGTSNVSTYTINIRDGRGWDSGDNPIDFSIYA